MPKWLWASQFHQPTSIIASTAAAGYAPQRAVTLDNHPLLHTWRSTTLAQQDLIIDYGSPKIAAGIALLRTNFTTVQLATSPDGSAYAFLVGSPYTISRDGAGLYKFFTPLAVPFRYFLIRIPAQSPVGGVAFFELGMVLVLEVLNGFVGSPRLDMERTVTRPYLRSGVAEVAPVGLPRTVENWNIIIPRSQQSTLETFALLGQHTPVLICENPGLSHQVRLVQMSEDMQARIGGTTYSMGTRVVEMM